MEYESKLNCKIIYILLIIENTTGMPHLKVTYGRIKAYTHTHVCYSSLGYDAVLFGGYGLTLRGEIAARIVSVKYCCPSPGTTGRYVP